jgi:hypothetical protein
MRLMLAHPLTITPQNTNVALKGPSKQNQVHTVAQVLAVLLTLQMRQIAPKELEEKAAKVAVGPPHVAAAAAVAMLGIPALAVIVAVGRLVGVMRAITMSESVAGEVEAVLVEDGAVTLHQEEDKHSDSCPLVRT